MDKNIERIVVQALPLLIPLNIYMVGEWWAVGFQWAFFRYQIPVAYEDVSAFMITLMKDFGYVSAGILSGRSAFSIYAWAAGALILLAALLVVLCRPMPGSGFRIRDYVPHATILAGLLLLLSCIFQYGVFLHGIGGFSIPVGVPAVFAIGYLTYRMDREDSGADDGEDVKEEV